MLDVSLPENIQAFVQEQARTAGFATASEYVYYLILQEQARFIQQAQVEALLAGGIKSGEPIELTEDWWMQKRSKLASSLGQP
ncbi:type II toxin-antitoxin system ParD family antitoxin [Sphaerothrix gracilis]|uniref:ribbon-helix-helix domain-containing protein n=1 Tax=Sphaerothrix gracilis TaxID=3151835 RepID=UPI0031FDA9CA